MRAQVNEAIWPDRSRAPRAGALIGSASGAISGSARRLAVVPNQRGRRLIASGRCVTARLRMTGVGADGRLDVLYRLGGRCKATPPVGP